MKGILRTVAGTTLNTFLLRSIIRPHTFTSSQNTYHFVCAHPDDECAILPQIKKAIKYANATFTFVTNGSQGYEVDVHGDVDSKQFGLERIIEGNVSLRLCGYKGNVVESLLDEQELYLDIVSKNENSLKEKFDTVTQIITKRITNAKAVFVNDYSGGHMIHDIVNMLTCIAARRTRTPVIEYWQAFLRKPESLSEQELAKLVSDHLESKKVSENAVELLDKGVMQIAGLVGDDYHGRKLRDQTPHKYTPYFKELGIKKGRAFNGLLDLFQTLQHLGKVYTSQKQSLDRLKSATWASHGLDAPLFREIDLDIVDHTRLPQNGILYDYATWRTRNLPRQPTSSDYLWVANMYKNHIQR